ncbi:MAG TPA: alkaline phosphatase family protein [Pyrinomonadaceae bacterium]|nr:alkaline phosphatase family protein [Pyrinomonadaceae bacterium]
MRKIFPPPRPAFEAVAGLLLALAVASSASALTAQRRAPRRPAPQSPPASASANRAAETAGRRPRLVLLIVVDQFRYEYLERFGDLFVAGGLRRLQREGASWANAHYDHTPPETGPGHATMLTGAWPAETGIIGNLWFERNAKGDGGRLVFNSEDDEARLLGGGEKERGSSPRRLLVSTLGDELRLSTNGRSKVVGISLKDRSAILPAGRQATAAYWFSAESGRMVTSDFYMKELPAWVARFNAAAPADKYRGQAWTRLLADESEYLRRAGPDDPEWEWKPAKAERADSVFPHRLPDATGRKLYDAFHYTPYANEMLVEFAREALTNEALGADEDTDVLSISLSANDYVGHRYGPYSQEVMDMALRADRQIAALLDLVEARVGLRNTVVAFTSDHGVGPIPEHAQSLRLPGGRLKPDDVKARVKEALGQRFNRPNDSRDRGEDYFLELTAKNGNIYLDLAALARDGVSREAAEQAACEGGLRVAGFARCFTRTQLERGAVSPHDALARRVLHGFHPGRSGDAVLVPEPFQYVVTYTADHYAPYSYDTHVPVIIMGGGVAAGTYAEPASPADIAPTLARLVRVQPPSNAAGRILIEALRK